MKISLYPHGGSGNHGCEALVRSTCQLLTGNDISLLSKNKSEDIHYGIGDICTVLNEYEPYSKTMLSYWESLFRYRILGDKDAFEALAYKNLLQSKNLPDVALSIGGDNYCYAKPSYIYIMNRLLRKRGVRTILWGCSIEPDFIDNEMAEDLRGYSMVFARESITYKALCDLGLKNVVLTPDPAFLLKRKDLPLPSNFIKGNTVGINVSPMILSYEKNSGITIKNYVQLISNILDKTDMNIALIPHVVWPDNDDRIPLKLLYDKFKESKRILMIDDCNAEELKGYIARCRFMVAARTHASIAAYSQGVPTLVVGYSVKALGIATDLFGKIDGNVLPVTSLYQSNTLADAFDFMLKNEFSIRNYYEKNLNKYISGLSKLKL